MDLECKETVCFIPVDSILAKDLIPADRKLYTEKDGAQILVIAQDCNSAILDGIELAPLKMAHIWIRLQGPSVITPVKGATETIPTFYWWDYAGKTTNVVFSTEIKKTAKHMDLVESIEFSLAGEGKVIETTGAVNNVMYEWFTTP